MSMTAKFDVLSVKEFADALRADVHQALRPAAQAGSQLLYERVMLNVPRSRHAHYFHGTSYKKYGTKYFFNPGTLARSIYQVFSKDNSGKNLATYHISWNHQEAPYGFMVEYGTKNAPPVGFVRRAQSAMPLALNAVEKELFLRLKEFK
jgi:hypothetical protein